MPDQHGRFLPGEHWRKPQAFREREWLQREYVERQRSTGEIAAEFGVTEAAIIHWLRRHGIPRRSIAEARRAKHWGPTGATNPMYGRVGPDNSNWKGGLTPDRQAFYSSLEWKAAVRSVWARDGGRCRRCDDQPSGAKSVAIHHIVAFKVKQQRAEITNLVLLCAPCHRWVHSRANTNHEFMASWPEGG